jgi:hypothetical protein
VNSTRTGVRRNRNALVTRSLIAAVESLERRGAEPTFSEILADLRSSGILSNHRSLRTYLDSLVLSGILKVRKEEARRKNVRPKEIYSLTHGRPHVEAGDGALLFHGLNWTIPVKSSIKLMTDEEGVARARLADGTLYASLEDVVVANLAAKRRAALERALPLCAALLATCSFDPVYLDRRAKEMGVGGLVKELLDEIGYIVSSPRPEVEDIRTLYAVRRRLGSLRRNVALHDQEPRWDLLSPHELVDVAGKQLGLE